MVHSQLQHAEHNANSTVVLADIPGSPASSANETLLPDLAVIVPGVLALSAHPSKLTSTSLERSAAH